MMTRSGCNAVRSPVAILTLLLVSVVWSAPQAAQADSVIWTQTVNDLGGIGGVPAVGDIDGDGQQEIVVAFGGSPANSPPIASANAVTIYAWHHDGTPVAGWPVGIQYYRGATVSPISLGELDGRPGLEVVFTVYLSTSYLPSVDVKVYRGDGTLYRSLSAGIGVPGPQTFGYVKPDMPLVIADLDGDGRNEVIAVGDVSIFTWRADGTRMPGWPIPLNQNLRVAAPLAVADLDLDRRQEVIAISRPSTRVSQLHVFQSDGSPALSWRTTFITDQPTPAPVVGNVRGSPTVTIMTSDLRSLYISESVYRLSVLRSLRAAPRREVTRFQNVVFKSDSVLTPVLGDVDQDGVLDVISSGLVHSFAISRPFEGLGVLGFTTPYPNVGSLQAIAEITTSPLVVRTADEARHVIAAATDGRVYHWVISRGGTGGQWIQAPLSGLPVDLQVNDPNSPTVADMDGDGDLELLVIGRNVLTPTGIDTNQGVVALIDLGVTGTPEWATLQGNAQRTGTHQPTGTTPPSLPSAPTDFSYQGASPRAP